MTYMQYLELKRLYPNASDETLVELQRKAMLDKIREKQQAEEQGREAAKAFTAAFEKELEKLFK